MNITKILNKVFRRRDVFHGDELYLQRWYLTPRKWPVKVFLHAIYKPDDDRDPHDHPFPFLGVILSGSYSEALYDTSGNFKEYACRTPGSWAYRNLKDIHKIETLYSDKVWTLIIAGPSKQVWGFHTKNGKIPWKEYQGKPATTETPAEDEPRY